MRKLIVFTLILALLLISVPVIAWADDTTTPPPPTDMESNRQAANTEIHVNYGCLNSEYYQEQNTNSDSLNPDTWSSGITLGSQVSRVLAYGDPFGMDDTGINRYLGETTQDEDFTNVMHPIDVMDVHYLDQLNWIPDPWSITNAPLIAALSAGPYGNVQESYFDAKTQLNGLDGRDHMMEYEIYEGLCDSTDGQYMHLPDPNDSGYSPDDDVNVINWTQYVHVWDPPTMFSWGMGIMFNTGSTIPASDLANAPAVYYKTVPLPPWNFKEGTLTVTPSTATVGIGGSQQYTATWTPPWANAEPETVTTSTNSDWTVDNTSIATIGDNTGLASGVAVGTANITDTYQPRWGAAVTNNPPATLIVQAQPPNDSSNGNGGGGGGSGGSGGSGYTGSLTFQAVSQSGTMNVETGQAGSPITRSENTAKWTDSVTATLTAGTPPEPQLGSTEQFDGFNGWDITSATLSYPLKNPDFSFGDPVDPANGATTSTGMAAGSGGPSDATATAKFQENWSMDGAGIHNLQTQTTMAASPQDFTPSATFTVAYAYTYQVWQVIGTDSNGDPIWGWGPEQTGSGTADGTATGTLKVDGTGAGSLAN